MQILTHEQRSAEWYAARAKCFTASEIGDFIAEQKEVRLTIAEITAMLQAQGMEPPKKAKKAELVALLPHAAELATWTQSTINARKKLIRKKLAEPFYSDRFANLAGAAWLLEIIDREERKIANDPAVQRGIQLEPLARAEYERLTGYQVTEVGLCVHESGGFGCSPDGLVNTNSDWTHGVEFKCPLPENHMEYLDDGTLPDQYKPQVHMSMAVTGLDRWDFLSFCPGLAPLLLTVERDEYTDRIFSGLLSLVDEMQETKARHAERWAKINKP